MTEELLRATVSVRGVLFTGDGRILVLERSRDGGWELPGGRLGKHERVVDGLCREVAEETSLSVDVAGPVHAISWRNADGNGRIGLYYRCGTEHQPVSLSDEHEAFQWVETAEATALLSDPQAVAVRRASGRRDSGASPQAGEQLQRTEAEY